MRAARLGIFALLALLAPGSMADPVEVESVCVRPAAEPPFVSLQVGGCGPSVDVDHDADHVHVRVGCDATSTWGCTHVTLHCPGVGDKFRPCARYHVPELP